MNPRMLTSGGNFGGGLAEFLGGLFGDSGKPYSSAMDQLKKYFSQSQGFQNPFYQAGTGAIPQFQSWLSGMQDPSKFINNLQSQYQQSPYNKFLQDQAMRAGTNAASMGGLANGMGGAGVGSTPFAQQMQQNASNIAAGGMNDWMSNVIGANNQYGAGLQGMMGMGQNSANALSQLAQMMGLQMGAGAYGQQAGQNQDFSDIIGGLIHMFL